MRNTRVPVAEITGFKGALLKWLIKKSLGQVPTSVGVYWHNQKVLMGMAAVGQKVQKWDMCDEALKTFAHMAVASYIGCTWCLDYNYFEARNKTSTWTRRGRCRAGASRTSSHRSSGRSWRTRRR